MPNLRSLWAISLVLAGCSGSDLVCGEGTHREGDICVPDAMDATVPDGGDGPDAGTDAGTTDAAGSDSGFDATSDAFVPTDAGTFDGSVPPPPVDEDPTRIEIYTMGITRSRIPEGVPLSVQVHGFVGDRSVVVDPARTTWSITGPASLEADGIYATFVSEGLGTVLLTAQVETDAGTLFAQEAWEVVAGETTTRLSVVLDPMPADVDSRVDLLSHSRSSTPTVGVGGIVRAATWLFFSVAGEPEQRTWVPPTMATLTLSGGGRVSGDRVLAEEVGRFTVRSQAFELSATAELQIVGDEPVSGLALFLHGFRHPYVVSTRLASAGDPTTRGDALRSTPLRAGYPLRPRVGLRRGSGATEHYEFLEVADHLTRHTDATDIAEIDDASARWLGRGVVIWTFEASGYVAALVLAARDPVDPTWSLELEPSDLAFIYDTADCVDVRVFLNDGSSRRRLTAMEELTLARNDLEFMFFPPPAYPDTTSPTRLCAPTRFSTDPGSVGLTYDFMGVPGTLIVGLSD